MVIAASMHVLGQGVDLVYMENLGTRGVAFEGPPAFSGFFDSSGNTCQGIGDFNGDGYDDIALTVRERQDSPNIFTLVLVMAW